MNLNKKILILDFSNYEDYPIGGYLSFAKNLMISFGNDLALVGISTTQKEPVGRWFKKEIHGVIYDFFAVARYNKSKTKHLIPDRLVSYMLMRYYMKRIFSINIMNIFIQRQEILLAVSGKVNGNICYCFAGLENPLNISKYGYARSIAGLFEEVFFKKLKNADTILASGDENAIDDMISRSKGLICRKDIVKFPTRINTDIFRPINRNDARKSLDLPLDSILIVTTGRLANLKGWEFLLNCFRLFIRIRPESLFYFIGEGEDLLKIEHYIASNRLTDRIILTGAKKPEEISLFLNSADIFVMGSYKEGWSTALLEAIACGTPACVTDFSSAKEIIKDGETGYVVPEHNEKLFVNKMIEALDLPLPLSIDYIKRYSTEKMKDDLLNIWNL